MGITQLIEKEIKTVEENIKNVNLTIDPNHKSDIKMLIYSTKVED